MSIAEAQRDAHFTHMESLQTDRGYMEYWTGYFKDDVSKTFLIQLGKNLAGPREECGLTSVIVVDILQKLQSTQLA